MKKNAACLTSNLNDSSEIDCIDISDDDVGNEDEAMGVLNDQVDVEMDDRLAHAMATPNAESTECGTQTYAIEWCNIAPNHCGPSIVFDKDIQTVQSHNMATQTVSEAENASNSSNSSSAVHKRAMLAHAIWQRTR